MEARVTCKECEENAAEGCIPWEGTDADYPVCAECVESRQFYGFVKFPDKKDTNPKDAVGIAKVPFLSVVPLRVIAEVALALFEGARKYGRHNYRPAGVRASVYMDAVGRHLAAWYEGEDIDPDSGLSHVTKAIAGLTVLRDSMMQGNWVDDRPPRVEPGWVAEMNEKAKAIIAKYPNAVPAHTERAQ